jgi:hypothetical protein
MTRSAFIDCKSMILNLNGVMHEVIISQQLILETACVPSITNKVVRPAVVPSVTSTQDKLDKVFDVKVSLNGIPLFASGMSSTVNTIKMSSNGNKLLTPH